MHASPSPLSQIGLFHPGERWLAVGDSITQHAGYQAAIVLYHATRFPGRALEPANAGIVGDFAGGALARYDWDIAPRRPSVATVMFGMNDVGQELYGPEIPSSELREKRRAALTDYEKNILRLTERLRADGARVMLLSPTPFDETAQNERPSRPGINTALAECAAILRRLACEHGHAFVDLHGPLTALNTRLQTVNPAATIVGPDRIHPGPAGHLLMAHQILKAQGAPDLVSRVEVDAAAGRVLAVENAGVSGLSASPGELAFTVEARALPYPISEDARPALAWIPFHDGLNRETLRVTNLAPGAYALFIDDTEIRRYSAEELAAGVNLALETTTPQMRQAAAAGVLLAQWRELLSLNLRRIALVEYWHLRELPRPVDFGAARRVLEGKLASTPDMDAYTRTCLEAYLAIKPAEAATRRELDALLARLRTECRPRPRVYRFVRI